jgi:hypothetical protein
MKKKAPAKTPPPRSRTSRTPAIIQGAFDFFFGGAASGDDGAVSGCAGIGGAGCGDLISPVITLGASTGGG